MFDWHNQDGKIVVKLPFEIYFGATFPLIIILILFINLREWFWNLYHNATKGKESEVVSGIGTPGKTGSMNNVGERDETKGLNPATNGIVQKVAESRTGSITSLSMAEQGVYGVYEGD